MEIRVTVKNTFSYVSKSFNALPLPVQNKFVKALSYQKRTSLHNVEEYYLLFKNPKATHNDHYYQMPTGLLHNFWKLAKENNVAVVFNDLRGAKPATMDLEPFFKRLQKVDSKIERRDYQIEAIEKCLKHRRGLIWHSTAAGKCFARDTTFLMYDGTVKKVQDIVVGDLLMGPDSRPRKVLSLARGKEMMYEIMPHRGKPHTVNESHVLSLKFTTLQYRYKGKKYKFNVHCGGKKYGQDDIANVKLKDYLDSNGNFKHCAKLWKTGVNFKANKKRLLIDPYFLGTQLDGIPHEYKTASRENRLKLLAGILDSAGHYNPKKGYEVTFVKEQLLDDTVFLARSLGLYASKKEVRKECCNNGKWGTYFRAHISGNLNQIPCRIKRKNASAFSMKKNPLLIGIKSVRKIGVDNYYGFTVAGDGLIMLDDFTVTHNTIVIAGVVYAVNCKTLILCIGKDHVFQMQKDIEAYVGGVTVFGSGSNNASGRIVIANAQALNAMKKRDENKFREFMANFGCVIADECHYISAISFRQVLYFAVNAYWRFGFSGTMHREDGSFLEVIGAIGPILHRRDYSYLESNNYIVGARFFFIDPNCTLLRGEANHWPYCLQTGIVNNQRRNEMIARVANHYVANGKQILIITPFRIEHGRIIQELIPGSKFLFGNVDNAERKSALEEFRNKEFMVIISSTIFDEVINLPDVRCVILAGGGKAQNKFFQRIGRGIRKSPGKEYVDVIIPWDSHGEILLRHSKKLKGYIRTIDTWRNNIRMVGNIRPEYSLKRYAE